MIRLLRGDCRETLATLEPGSCQVAITSPPYWGLRSYGTPDLVWGGDAEHEHEWGVPQLKSGGGGQPSEKVRWQHTGAGPVGHPKAAAGSVCPCGAWLGSLGLEPTPDCGRRGMVRLRRDLTPAQREYVVRRLLGAAPPDAVNGGTDDTA